MPTKNEILRLLSDGSFHSGTEMGAQLSVSRAAINKAIKLLSQAGVDIHRVSGRGYRLAEPTRPLDKKTIIEKLSSLGRNYSDRLHVFDEVESTSQFLSSVAVSERVSGSICIAETQLGGRGRRGRTWVATPYQNIMMSMSWQFDRGPASVAGLSLAAGVAVVRALEEFGLNGVGLKWPNDVLWQERKLAGLLLDVQGEAAGPSSVILGLGVNVAIADNNAEDIDQPWVDIKHIIDGPVDRNELIAILITKFDDMFSRFDASGLTSFEQDWQAAHVYHGKAVRLIRGNDVLLGTVEGIDANGALKLRNEAGNINYYHSGEVSLRAVGHESAD